MLMLIRIYIHFLHRVSTYSFSTAGHTIGVENNPTQFLYSKLKAVLLHQSSTKDTAATSIKRRKG